MLKNLWGLVSLAFQQILFNFDTIMILSNDTIIRETASRDLAEGVRLGFFSKQGEKNQTVYRVKGRK
jgi:hypothetical protein